MKLKEKNTDVLLNLITIRLSGVRFHFCPVSGTKIVTGLVGCQSRIVAMGSAFDGKINQYLQMPGN